MTWESHALTVEPIEEKKRVITEALDRLTETADLCRSNGHTIDIVSCGGTGTYWISAFHPGITEIEAGGGINGEPRGIESEALVLYRDRLKGFLEQALDKTDAPEGLVSPAKSSASESTSKYSPEALQTEEELLVF